MSITSDLIRGNTDTIILAQLRLGDSYGYKNQQSHPEEDPQPVRAEGSHPLHRIPAAGGKRIYLLLLGGREHRGAPEVLHDHQ